MSCKRSCEDQDPDYEDDVAKDQKRLRLIEKDNVEATVKKIEKIIETQFSHEMKIKEAEIDAIDERLYEARQMLDQLRAGIIISYYSFDNPTETAVGQKSIESKLPIHPAVKKLLGKIPTSKPSSSHGKLSVIQPSNSLSKPQPAVKRTDASPHSTVHNKDSDTLAEAEESGMAGRLKVKKRIIIGNVSKYIPLDQREDRDQSTHKWMVYVRGPKEEPSIHSFVSKVWFFLHPSYRPNDIVEINQPPFHLTRRGWGEFPVRVQLYFRDPRNKRVDVIHTLKLDKTYTGLQTLGAETVVDVVIFKDDNTSCISSEPQQQVAVPYSLPSGTGGISIPASEVVLETTNTSELLSPRIKNEKVDIEHDKVVEGIDSVSSFINDHGTYVNQAVKSENVLNDSSCNHSDVVSQKQVTIKQEPPDYIEADESPTQANDVKLTSLLKMSSSVSLLNSVSQMKNTSILRKEIISNKANSANSTSGKATLILNSSVGKTGPAAVSILNSKHKLTGQSLITLPKNNANLPILVVPQKSSSTSCTNAAASSTGESKLQLRTHLASSPQSADSASSSPKEVEQKLHSGNGVATFVKCVDRRGNVYLIPLPMFLKMSPSAQANLVRDAAQIQNSTSSSSTDSGISLTNSVISSAVEDSSSNDSNLNFGVRHSKAINETSTALSKSVVSSENPLPSFSGIGKLSWTPTTSPGKQLLTLAHNQIISNNKTSTSSDADVSINIDDYDDFRYVIGHIVKQHPVVASNIDRSLHPYCASTLEDFMSWNVGKRHAAEWHRAKSVRDKLIELIAKSAKWKSTEMWTTKQFYVWFRCHGYTPLKFEPNESQLEEAFDKYTEFSTFASASDLLQRLTVKKDVLNPSQADSSEDEEDDQEIDIVTEDSQKVTKKSKSPEKLMSSAAVCLPFSKDGIIVQETCRQIGINLQPEEVCHDVMAPLAETVILSAMKSFLEDVTRLAVNERFKRIKDKRCSSCIETVDVAQAICRLPVADFVTNSGLGVKVTTKSLLNANDIKL